MCLGGRACLIRPVECADACARRATPRSAASPRRSEGTNTTARQVEAIMPLKTAMPIDRRAPAPAPVAMTSGKTPRMKANEVMRIGRNLSRAASTAASTMSMPSARFCARIFDDQDRVLAAERDQKDEADLRVEIVGGAESRSARRPFRSAPAARRGSRTAAGSSSRIVPPIRNRRATTRGRRRNRSASRPPSPDRTSRSIRSPFRSAAPARRSGP